MAVERVLEPRAHFGYCMYSPRAIVQQKCHIEILISLQKGRQRNQGNFPTNKTFQLYGILLYMC